MGGAPLVGARGKRGAELSVLLQHQQAAGESPLLEALLELRSGVGPQPVRAAAERLVRDHARWALDLAKPAQLLIAAAGSERDQRLFIRGSLCPEGRTFEDLAEEEGICRQRANGVVRRSESRVRDALAGAPAPLPWAVATLRTRLGTVATAEELATELGRLGAGKPPVAALLAWLAGPYLPVAAHPGWVAAQPKELVARTADCLAADGGVRPAVDVETELVHLGVRPQRVTSWLGANSAVVIHDVVVSVSGPLAEVAERVLDAHGSPRTAEQIAADLARGGRCGGPGLLAGALRQRRFTQSAKGPVSLAAWARTRPNSVHQGVGSGGGAPKKAPAPPGPAHEDGQASPEQWCLWVRVDPEVLRGSEAAVPVALVEGLGLAPLSRRTFSSRWGPVTLAYDTLQPTRGPVRAVALAAGAHVDDTLLLGFKASGDLDVEVRRGAGRGPGADDVTKKAVIFPETVSGGAP